MLFMGQYETNNTQLQYKRQFYDLFKNNIFMICLKRYRAPECLLTDGWYTYKMDLWSIGCVFAEILR